MTDQPANLTRRASLRVNHNHRSLRFGVRSIVIASLLALLLTACGDGSVDGGGTDVDANGGTNAAAGDADAAPDDTTDDDTTDDVGEEADQGQAAASGTTECVATDARLPEAEDRDLVALMPVPDSLTDAGDTFSEMFATGRVSGQTNTDVDPRGAVDCIAQLIDDLGWDVVYTSDDGSIDTANGHTFVATHPDLPDGCLNAAIFASAHTPVVGGDAGTRVEMSLRELPEGVACQF